MNSSTTCAEVIGLRISSKDSQHCRSGVCCGGVVGSGVWYTSNCMLCLYTYIYIDYFRRKGEVVAD